MNTVSVLVPAIRRAVDVHDALVRDGLVVPLSRHWRLVAELDSHRWGLGGYVELSGAHVDGGAQAGLVLGPVGVFVEPRAAA